MRPTKDRNEPAPSGEGGGASRPASHRLPRKTAAEMTNAATPRPNVAPTRVQKTESKPTLRNHSASVHRSMPTLNSRKTAMTAIPTT
jgi:hypothetical protein